MVSIMTLQRMPVKSRGRRPKTAAAQARAVAFSRLTSSSCILFPCAFKLAAISWPFSNSASTSSSKGDSVSCSSSAEVFPWANGVLPRAPLGALRSNPSAGGASVTDTADTGDGTTDDGGRLRLRRLLLLLLLLSWASVLVFLPGVLRLFSYSRASFTAELSPEKLGSVGLRAWFIIPLVSPPLSLVSSLLALGSSRDITTRLLTRAVVSRVCL